MHTYLGEEFHATVATSGIVCRFCFQPIPRGAKVAVFPAQPPVFRYECVDCMKSEPLNDSNRRWRGKYEHGSGTG